MRTSVYSLGGEGQPLLVIDDFWPEPDALIADACGRPFAPIGPYYPGVRAVVPAPIVQAMLRTLDPLLTQHFAHDPARATAECFYSLVTTPPASLQPIQRLPHFDGLEAARLAVLLYLADDDQGGTAFYRHRATGFETIDAARLSTYDAQLRAEVARHGLPPAAYIGGDTPLFERIHLQPAARNRLLVYRGHCLHCAHVPPAARLSADPRSGRLTINLFLGVAHGG